MLVSTILHIQYVSNLPFALREMGTLANNEHPDETRHNVAFFQGPLFCGNYNL